MKKGKKSNVMSRLVKEVKNKYRPVETGKVTYNFDNLANFRCSYEKRSKI